MPRKKSFLKGYCRKMLPLFSKGSSENQCFERLDFFLLRLEVSTIAMMTAAIIAMMLTTAAAISAPALASLTGAELAVGDGRAVADGETLGETLADGEGLAEGDALGFGVALGLGEAVAAAAVTVIFTESVNSHSPSSLQNRQATVQPFMSLGTLEMVNTSLFPPLTLRLGK